MYFFTKVEEIVIMKFSYVSKLGTDIEQPIYKVQCPFPHESGGR